MFYAFKHTIVTVAEMSIQFGVLNENKQEK